MCKCNCSKMDKDINQQFIEIGDVICNNYSSLQKELGRLKNVIETLESYVISYSDNNFIKSHLNANIESFEYNILNDILDKLEDIKELAIKEFLHDIDLMNIVEEVLKITNKFDMILYIWKAKNVLSYIKFQMGRISNTAIPFKRVAILKGMIAYY